MVSARLVVRLSLPLTSYVHAAAAFSASLITHGAVASDMVIVIHGLLCLGVRGLGFRVSSVYRRNFRIFHVVWS